MSALDAHVEDYLRLRRALGFKLERHGLLLPQLVAYLETAGATTVTSELAIAWARMISDSTSGSFCSARARSVAEAGAFSVPAAKSKAVSSSENPARFATSIISRRRSTSSL